MPMLFSFQLRPITAPRHTSHRHMLLSPYQVDAVIDAFDAMLMLSWMRLLLLAVADAAAFAICRC